MFTSTDSDGMAQYRQDHVVSNKDTAAIRGLADIADIRGQKAKLNEATTRKQHICRLEEDLQMFRRAKATRDGRMFLGVSGIVA